MTDTPNTFSLANRIELALPAWAKPYVRLARLDKPIGWWLLLLPGWWAIALAQVAQGGGMPRLDLLALFLLGAILTRAAGCTLNDLADRDIDAKVARTRTRPLASGEIGGKGALAFMALLLAASLLILVQFNAFAIVVGLLSAIPVLVYPFMKRVTYWPQAFLGIAFNWGALLGWAAVFGALGPVPFLIYAAGIAWTLAYDTIYAHQDREDDLLVGVKSSAIRLGRATRPWVAGFFGLTLAGLALAGYAAGAGPLYMAGLGAAGVHAAWQVARLDIDDPSNCLRLFRSNRDFGLIVFAGAVLESLARAA
jgi:4-hydroxybenzoate polyprenyltransferase